MIILLTVLRNLLLASLLTTSNTRFEDKSVMATFDMFNPMKLPVQPEHATDEELEQYMEEFMHYGNSCIVELSTRFHGVCASTEICLEEWSGYRQYLHDNCLSMRHRDIIQELCTNCTIQEIFPNMSTFARICRVIPIHTAGVERTFSN